MNLVIEQAFVSWLRTLEALEGVTISAGQSDDEIPGDAPLIVCVCDQDDLVATGLHKATVRLIASTPGQLETATHAALASTLQNIVPQMGDMAEHLPENIQLAGAVLNAFAEMQTGNRRMASAEILLGVTQI